MFELAIFVVGGGVGALAMALAAVSKHNQLEDALAERDVLQLAKDSLALSLKAAELSRDQAERERKRLASENTDLQREAGRYAAELRAANQRLAKFERSRGKGGKFVRKDPPKPAPISCA